MNNKDWFLVILLGIIWGSSFLFVEILLVYLSPFVIVYLRITIASILLIIFTIIKKERIEFSILNLFNLFILGLFNNVIPFLLITSGQQSTTGGLASILNANTSIAAIVLSALFIPKEKLTINRVIGVIIGIVGVIIAIGYENLFGLIEDNIGKYLILLATFSYAFASIWAKLRMNKISPIIMAAGMLTMSSIILTPFALTFHMNEILTIEFKALIYAILFSIICSFIAYIIFFIVLESAGPGNLSICTIIIPPSAIFLNTLFLQEIITMSELIGSLIIIFGLIILDGRILKNNFLNKNNVR